MIRRPLQIALTFDADPDVFDPSLGGQAPGAWTWRGVEEGIPLLRQAVSGYASSQGSAPKATWYARVDAQVEAFCGDAAYVLRKFDSLWRSCVESGDLIGWHPHLYRQTSEGWRQAQDAATLRDLMRESFQAMTEAGYECRVSRMGESFGSNEVMATLATLGVVCDSTAMPGRVRRDGIRHLDWEGTPDTPYYPSATDYRRPGPDALRILEVPFSMAMVKADYDSVPLRRYVDLSFHHRVLAEGLKECIARSDGLVTVTHPSTVLKGEDSSHGLLSFDVDEFRRNLDWIIAICGVQGRAWEFVRMDEMAERLGSRGPSGERDG